MILKASQRGGGQDLAGHLMKTENEHVLVHDLRGFASEDLRGAFKEAEAISRGTKCRQYLFSLSLSPPERESVAPDVFEKAIERIEERLGLSGQPRALVFHEKEGRRHAHCVWSRIDAETMTAKQLSFFKTKLKEISRELYLENGWALPRGLANVAERNQTNFTLAEWQQAKRQGIDPRWVKQSLQECWNHSDSRAAFVRALEERGYLLAKGDKRGFVVLDHSGEVYSLPRALSLKAKDVRARLGDPESLPNVADTHKIIAGRMTPAIKRHVAESRLQFQKRSATLDHYKMEMTQLHRDARAKLQSRQSVEWQIETRDRAARLPKGLRGLWHRITGKYQEVRRLNEHEAKKTQERHALERHTLIEQQLAQRRVLQDRIKDHRRAQYVRLVELRKDIGRFFKLARTSIQPERRHDNSLGLKLQR